MALTAQPFANIVTFTRDSGATRVNAAGLIVGVDFSSTSNTIGTGSRTFTLAADANVNRDWVVGSRVRAVSQAGAVGTMDGTVTSYTPSTQALVINVTSITGSGTSTNWRIGSLEFRRDFDPVTLAPRGGLVEAGATNEFTNSIVLNSGDWSALNGTLTNQGTLGGFRYTVTTQSVSAVLRRNSVGTAAKTGVFHVKRGNTNRAYISTNNVGLDPAAFADIFDFTTESFVSISTNTTRTAFVKTSIDSYILFTERSGSLSNGGGLYVGLPNEPVGSFIDVFAIELRSNSPTLVSSLIPTTTVAVTRAADLPNVDGTRFGQFYRTEGTLVLELTPIAAAVGAVAASINNGTLNNAIRVQQKQSGTLGSIRKMATDGQTDVMGINATGNNTLRSNGVDYNEVSTQGAQSVLGVASSGLNQFLTAGSGEVFRSSADAGASYNARTIGGSFTGAHFGIGRFVIGNTTATINGATAGSVMVSSDGLSFRRVNIPGLSQRVQFITSNETNLYVFGTVGGFIYSSPDAETWTLRHTTTGDFAGAAFGNGTYVITNLTAASSRYSTDGITWLAVTGLTGIITDVVWTGSQFVAVNTVGGVFTSTNGQTFTAVTTTGITPAFTIAAGITFATIGGNGYYVIVGNGGQVAVSQTAANASPTTWTTYTNGGTPSTGTAQQLNEVRAFGSKFYIAGGSQVIVEFDPVAITFTSRAANVSSSFEGIATNGTRLLICGSNGAITTSEDGVTFTSRTGNATQLNGAAFGAGTYVIAGNAVNGSGLIATVDPVTFAYQRRVSGVAQNIESLGFASGVFYFSTNSGLYSSTDGANWNLVIGQGANNGNFGVAREGQSIVYLYANNGNAQFRFSSDGGATFGASTTIVNGVILRAVSVNSGLFVAVGDAGRIYTSTNGTTWTLSLSGTTANLFTVMYSTRDSLWYAAGDNGVIVVSGDAITWTLLANDAAAAVIRNGLTEANPLLPNLIPNQLNKVAMRIQANNVAASVNGSDAVVDMTVSLPSPLDRFSIGMNGVNGSQFNGWIRRMRFLTTAESNASLKSLST